MTPAGLANRLVDCDPRAPDFVQDPYAFYRHLHRTTPRFYWAQYGHWCFASHRDVNALLRDRRFGRQILHMATREELGLPPQDLGLKAFDDVERYSLLELEPPLHTQLRGFINRPFLARAIDRLAAPIGVLAHRLIDALPGGRKADLLVAFARPLALLTIVELLGLAEEAAPRLAAWSQQMVAMYQFARSRQTEAAAVTATQAFVAFLRSEIAARRARPRDDLIGRLIAAETDGRRLDEDQLVSLCVLLVNAGHEATASTLANALALLLGKARRPIAERKRAPDAALIEECLRFDPPLHLFTRYALEPCDIDGISLAKGERIGLLLGAANHDPAQFAAPERFDFDRSPNPHVSFGAGIHFCLGAPLARLELQIGLAVLFERLPGLALAKAPRYRNTYHFRQPDALWATW
jgi:cytochrome P450